MNICRHVDGSVETTWWCACPQVVTETRTWHAPGRSTRAACVDTSSHCQEPTHPPTRRGASDGVLQTVREELDGGEDFAFVGKDLLADLVDGVEHGRMVTPAKRPAQCRQ